MLKIKALNQESSSDEDVPTIRREAQEEIALELYNNALRAQAQKKYTDSEIILTQLIEKNIPQLENNGGLPKSMSTLKYSCYVNLGNIYINQNNVLKSLESFSEASKLDSTDVTLWSKIGKLSLKVNKFNKAAYAFSKGLECSESHWPCLDNLISVLYAIKDTVSCLVYIGKALLLDPGYTKGLVLRQQIYQDNPATRDYYKLFNPEHIWEPPLDVEIDQIEKETILKEAQILCDKIIELEKELGPKPFNTIPLPKTLNEYTWVSLATTVIYCHKYITDNNLSHFDFFDMTKSMSQPIEFIEPITASKVVEDVAVVKDNKPSSDIIIGDNMVESTNVEKMDTNPALCERRFSQNSENTNGNENLDNTTPIHTDNDEEQNMELDNDNETDGDIQGENNDATNQRRKGKRKRDVLVDLQIWGWHSKRKQPKKVNKDYTVQDALNRIIPTSLLRNKINLEMINQGGEDSMNTMDIYNMYVENKELNFLSPIHSPKSVNYEAYFGTDREKDDVSSFWSRERPRVDAVVLVKEVALELSRLWQYKWPKELVALYIQVFRMFREHCDQPQVFCTEMTSEEIKNDALATLLYGELICFSAEPTENVPPNILSYLQIVSGWNENWQEEYSFFSIRYYWLQSHCFRKTDQNELAIRAMEVILEEIEEKGKELSDRFSLSLSNCFKYGFINKQIINKIIKHLNMIISLGNIENLFNRQKYVEVSEILKQTFNSGSYSKVGRLGRPAQLAMLMHSLWLTTDWEQCFVWTEECLFEALQNYDKPNAVADQTKWVKVMEKCLGIFQAIIRKETACIVDRLTEEKRCRLVECLCKIICKQLNGDNDASMAVGCITPWIVLHFVLFREEQRLYARKRLKQTRRGKITPEPADEELPPSIAILCSAHDFLGPKGWCLAGNGELLHFILDTTLDRLDTPIFEPFRDKIDIHIEQAMFCLYLYPSKKNKISRHLVDHNVNPIPLTWERSFQLYQYYAPESLPEFNSYKNASISSDLEQLFKRIIGLVPSICALHDQLPKIMDFIHGKTDRLPDAVPFPNKVRAIYYLIGDYFFKEKEFARCIKYFQLDLCINPMRLDSWASLGLSYAAQLENTLNYCEKFKNEADFFDKAKSAQICFKKALELDPESLVLWIECGSFEYMVHSFCSRLIKFESESFSMEKFSLLESEKESYLESSGNSLEHAIGLYEIDDSNEPDERWLQYYILGKIAEKKRKEPAEYLQYYLTASTLLHENKATYPEKINYNNPQHLSVEALELHYRIHASVLKYLELHEGKDILNTLGTFFNKCLNSSAKHFAAPPAPPPLPQLTKTVAAAENSSTSFQDQFLNSIKNLKENSLQDSVEVLQESNIIVKQCLEDILDRVDKIVEEPKLEVSNPKENSDEKSKDLDVSIIEEEEVIMIISDSDDESSATVKKVTTPEGEEKRTTPKSKEDEMDVDCLKPVEDVQSLLDKMMEQTMKDTEKMVDSDANNSSIEQIEEVIVKEDTLLDVQNGEMVCEQLPVSNVKASDSEVTTTTTSDKKKMAAAATDVDVEAAESSSSSCSSSSDSDSSTSADDDSETDDDDDSEESSSSSDDDDAQSSRDSKSPNEDNMSNSEILQLVDRCVQGLEICITRLPQNYKALYRLAHLFFNYKGRKDYTKCKQLLLGEYKCKDGGGTFVTGLFSERKTTNFFNGIWRIPSTEIDRPGSLAAHMNRCISLVLQVLRNTNDTKALMEICMQLRKVPDRDKIYIRDSDRRAFSEQAMSMCIQSFKSQIRNLSSMQNQQMVKLLHDIFRTYQRVQKHMPTKESTFSTLLTDVYRKFINENIPDTVNVLDLAIKFCMQHKSTEKHKTPPPPSLTFARGPPAAAAAAPGVAISPPVHPSPSTFVGAAAAAAQKPLKPPSLGRPRGRPPLPKIPGQVRAARTKTASTTMGQYPAWPNSMYGSGSNFSYEYLKHYQDELIKQYSQSLTVSQLNQLTQFLSTGSPRTQPNPIFFPQTTASSSNPTSGAGGGSSSGLLQPITSSIETSHVSKSPLIDTSMALKGFTPQLTAPSFANLTPDQIKFLESMLPAVSKKSSSSKSSNVGAYKSYSSSSFVSTAAAESSHQKAGSGLTNKSSSTTDVQKLKQSSGEKLFKEPVYSKVHHSSSDDIGSNMLDKMKVRPNLSITAIGSSSSAVGTSTTNSSFAHSGFNMSSIKNVPSLATRHNAPPVAITSYPATKVSTSSSSTTFSKPVAAPAPVLSIPSHTSPSTSKPPSLAHFSSSTSPKPAHTSSITPPPVSSPSFIKSSLSTSPGKTLQEKLADKKKEQETKQLMKNIEAEIFATNYSAPAPTSIMSQTSSSNMNHLNMPPRVEQKQQEMATGLLEHKLPSSLTVSKSAIPPPLPLFTPTFSTESGISISQISPTKIKSKLTETQTTHRLTKPTPISLDHPMNISPHSPKDVSRLQLSFSEAKNVSGHTTMSRKNPSSALLSTNNPTAGISIKKKLFNKPGSRRDKGSSIAKRPRLAENVVAHQPEVATQQVVYKDVAKQTGSISKDGIDDKQALSVIQKMSSIDISLVFSASKETVIEKLNEEVICLDSDDD